MFKLNGIKMGAVLLMLSSIANAAVVIDSQQIPSEDIVSITISPNSGNMFITTAVGYEVKPVGGGVVDPDPISEVSITSFTASPASIVEGGSTTLIWNTQNAAACTPSGGTSAWPGRTIGTPNGSTNISIGAPGIYTFRLTCQSSTGNTTLKNADVEVTEAPLPQTENCPVTTLSGSAVTWKSFWGANYPSAALLSETDSVPRSGYSSYVFNTGNFTGNASVVSIGLTNTVGTKIVAVSKCPGDFAVPAACKKTYGLANGITWSTTPGGNKVCLVEPNTTYYLNVTFTDGVSSSTGTCTSSVCQVKLQYDYR